MIFSVSGFELAGVCMEEKMNFFFQKYLFMNFYL